MKLSENINNHVIVFFDGSRKFVTEELAMKIMGSSDPAVTLPGTTESVRLSAIQKLLPIDEFYKQYPKEIPPNTEIFEPDAPRVPWKAKQALNAYKQFLEGYEKYKVSKHGLNWEVQKVDDETYKKITRKIKAYQSMDQNKNVSAVTSVSDM